MHAEPFDAIELDLSTLWADVVQAESGTLAYDTQPERTTPPIVALTPADWPEMHALAAMTKPGPFAAQTPILGDFWGIKVDGRLLAMAGERLRHAKHTELSGVCTHPDARGRGWARTLSIWVSERMCARGEVPYLHAYASNTQAIELYQTIGFTLRRMMNVAAIASE